MCGNAVTAVRERTACSAGAPMKKTMPSQSRELDVSVVRKVALIDNPILRYFIKKHRLNDADSLLLGTILDLTDQMKTPIKATYHAIAESSGLSSLSVYRGIESLHRNRIIEYKPSGDFVHISFRAIDENIEEISLAYRNAKKIRTMEEELAHIRSMKYVPSAELFDLIYPVVGKLVAKKVADAFRAMVNYINDRLESSFSLKMWGYRFRSWRTGIPVAELVLRDSLPFYIEEIFLLEKKSSLLIGHASRTGDESIDKDLVGGMLAAINDFIRTSFRGDGAGLNEIQFGDSRIIITESAYFHAAVVTKGSPDMQFMERSESVLGEIHARYRRQLKNFNGSMDGLAGIEAPLARLIQETNTPAADTAERKSLAKVKIAAALLGLLLAAGLAWWGYSAYRDRALERRITEKIRETMPPFTHDVTVRVSGGLAVVEGTVSSKQDGERIGGIVGGFGEIRETRNRAVTTDYRTVEKYRGELDELDRRLRSFQLVAVKQELEKIVVQFPAGVTALGDAQVLQIRRAREILGPYGDIHVDIIAFNDPAGGYDLNKRLAEGRIRAVSDYLARLGIARNRLHPADFSPGILESDPRFAEYKDRRGVMLFAKFAEK